MLPGDLVIYCNTPRMIPPRLGIILSIETPKYSRDTGFYNVLFPGGCTKLITANYLRLASENPPAGVVSCGAGG